MMLGRTVSLLETQGGALLLAAVLYVLLNLVLAPGGLYPVHQDDYHVLGAGFDQMRLLVERPVSNNLAYVMGGLGAGFAFLLLNTLTVLAAAGALAFLSRLLSVQLRWYAVVLFAVIAFNDPSAYEHGKYLGLISNLTSHCFGIAALLLLLKAAEARSIGWAITALATFALSAFSKEDFLLPPLLLAAFLLAKGVMRAPRVQGRGVFVRILLLGGTITVAALSLWFNLALETPFLAGLAGGAGGQAHYAVGLAPVVLAKSLMKLTVGYIPVALALGLAGGVSALVLLPPRRAEILLVGVIIFALVLPYAAIPNNSPQYRVFAWLPWLAGMAAIGTQLLADRLQRKTVMLPWIAPLAVLIGAIALFVTLRQPRMMVAGWYEEVQGANARMGATLGRNREAIVGLTQIGVVGIDGLSPWSNNNGEYLQRRLGFAGSWIVFVEKDSPMFAVEPSNPIDPRVVPMGDHVFVQPLSQLCRWTGLRVLAFDKRGEGAWRTSDELCTVASGSRIEP